MDEALTNAGCKLVVLDPILTMADGNAEAYFKLIGENHAKLLEALKK